MLKPYLAPRYGMFHIETENEKISYMEHALQDNYINYKFGPCLPISSTYTSLFLIMKLLNGCMNEIDNGKMALYRIVF